MITCLKVSKNREQKTPPFFKGPGGDLHRFGLQNRRQNGGNQMNMVPKILPKSLKKESGRHPLPGLDSRTTFWRPGPFILEAKVTPMESRWRPKLSQNHEKKRFKIMEKTL